MRLCVCVCVFTAEFFLQINEELFSAHRVIQQLHEAEAPALHTQFSRHSNSVSGKPLYRAITDLQALLYLRSLMNIKMVIDVC